MAVHSPVPQPRRFSIVLRDSTRDEHQAAEDSPFMRRLIAGEGTRGWYAALAGQLWFVYDALETAARHLAGDRSVRPFLAEELHRVPALADDLHALLGPRWRQDLSPSPATLRYTARILKVAQDLPAAYVAHHYTRYLGDLSGGQILRRVLQREYGLTEDHLSFYSFPGIPRPKLFKDRYRAQLDTFGDGLTASGRDLVVGEARAAFSLNRAVFEDVAAIVARDAA